MTDNYEYMAHMAWLSGASSAAQALIREVDLVKSAWGKGDEQKTLMLIKLCAPHMISVWLGGIDQQPGMTGDARRVPYESAASSMLSCHQQVSLRQAFRRPCHDSAGCEERHRHGQAVERTE